MYFKKMQKQIGDEDTTKKKAAGIFNDMYEKYNF